MVEILRDTPDYIEPVIRHLGRRSVRLLLSRGARSGLTGGSPSDPSAKGRLPASPPGNTEPGVNKESDVGRELGGVGMYTGTGFRQPIP
jgi:hypothetical protein